MENAKEMPKETPKARSVSPQERRKIIAHLRSFITV